MNGVVICGHGSRSAEALHDFETFVEEFKKRNPQMVVSHGFLELSKPSIYDAVELLYNQGVRTISALQLFLFSGKHIEKDIPHQIKEIEGNFPELKIVVSPVLGSDSTILEIIALSVYPLRHYDKKQALLTVGVGATVETANKQIAEVSKQLSKLVGIDDLHVSFMSKSAKPGFEETITSLANTVDEIIVVPLLLFNGVYYTTINTLSNHIMKQTGKAVFVLPTIALQSGFLDYFTTNGNKYVNKIS
jgi:sirohydrochlorin cobaltochelatase